MMTTPTSESIALAVKEPISPAPKDGAPSIVSPATAAHVTDAATVAVKVPSAIARRSDPSRGSNRRRWRSMRWLRSNQ
jgi:hypothetical protein